MGGNRGGEEAPADAIAVRPGGAQVSLDSAAGTTYGTVPRDGAVDYHQTATFKIDGSAPAAAACAGTTQHHTIPALSTDGFVTRKRAVGQADVTPSTVKRTAQGIESNLGRRVVRGRGRTSWHPHHAIADQRANVEDQLALIPDGSAFVGGGVVGKKATL